MLTFKVLSKEPQERLVGSELKAGFMMRVVLAPQSGNRESVYLFASAAFVDANDPLAALEPGQTFPLSL